jgi:hypothetical protein
VEDNQYFSNDDTASISEAMSVYDDSPALESFYVKKNKINLSGEVLSLVASANETVPLDRQIGRYEAITVLQRSLEKTMLNVANPSQRAFVAMREVADYVNMATTGAKPKVASEHTDLLPVGHPLSTRANDYSANDVMEFKAEWISADPRIADEFRPLVASAYKTPKNTFEREYVLAKLEATSAVDVPRDVVLGLATDQSF